MANKKMPAAAGPVHPVVLTWDAPQGEPPTAQWLLTFTDLVALLVCFFVLMFSMRELDVKAWDAVRGSFDGVFTLVPSDVAQTPNEEPQATVVAPKKGSVLPYLQQVLWQKLGGVGGWDTWQGTYDRERDELWYVWRPEADVAPLANIFLSWKNEVGLVAGTRAKLPEAFAALDNLRSKGALVVQEVVLDPALADDLWLVVKGTQ